MSDHNEAASLLHSPRPPGDEAPLDYLEPSGRSGSLGRLGHYEVLEVLGAGAFGTVLKALDDRLGRVVAIKVIGADLAATSPARKRFLREARASAAIRHEHVVSVYAVEDKPLPYLVMEYVPGQTLQQRLDQCGPFDVAGVLRLGTQIAEGLAAAHAMDLIHLDIKPGNILLDTTLGDRVKITDFGLARAADDASLSQSGVIAGTPMYMSPEQALGHRLDRRADLFSLGSVLYQMASGRPPFRASSAMAVLKRVVEDTPRPLREVIPETPRWLCDIIARLHAKNPDDRFESARAVADLLADCEAKLKSHGQIENLLPVIDKAPAAAGGRNPWMAAALLLIPCIALLLTEMLGVTDVLRGRMRPADAAARTTAARAAAVRAEAATQGQPEGPAQAKQRQQTWAARLDLPAESTNSLGMKFVLIPPGGFLMGTPENEPGRKPGEGPRHEVDIGEPFLLGACEVTVGQFRTFVKAAEFVTETERLGGAMIWDVAASVHKRDSTQNWKNPGHEQTDDHPVACVSWNDAQAFCRWLTQKEGRKYSLPTEAQWEYACRAGTTTAWSFGDREDGLDASGWHVGNAAGASHAVGRKSANAWGLFDLHGNVWEWTADPIQPDYSGAQTALSRDGSVVRAMRGGSRVDLAAELRCGNRGWLPQDLGNNVVGFRVACAIDPVVTSRAAVQEAE